MSTIVNSTKKLNSAFAVLDRLADIALLFLLCIITSHDGLVEGENYLYYIAFFFFVGVMFFRALFRKTINFSRLLIPTHTIWYGIFVLLCLASSLWAKNSNATMFYISRMTQNLVLSYFLIINVTDKHDFRRYENIFILSNVYMTLRILLATPIDKWFSRFLGDDITGHNVNFTAFYLSIVIIILFYRFYIEQKRYNIFLLVLLSFMVVLTSSRKSLLMIIVGCFLVMIFDKSKGKKALKIGFLLLGIVIFVYLMFTNEYLYRAIGWKFDSMLNFLEHQQGDQSLHERKFFRDFAFKLFLEHPIIGVGLNNFSTYLKGVFLRATYSHNNWLEMLSCLGIVGFVTYYWFYVYCITKLYKQVRKRIRSAIAYLAILICMVIFEYSMIVYHDTFIQLSVALLFLGASVNDSKINDRRLRR